MPFDPLSIIGYIGTAAGLIGFLASTVTRLEQLGREYEDCGPQLEWYCTRLKTIEWILLAWKRLWCQEGHRTYSDAEYLRIWGRLGFEEMERKWTLIDIEIQAIGKLLFSGWEKGPNNAANNDIRAVWTRRSMFEQQLREPGEQFISKLTWLQRICFASFKKANLEERIKRLKDKVDDLKESSRIAYWNAQYELDVDVAVTQAELARMLHRKQFMDVRASYLDQLYIACHEGNHAWSLVLSAPDDEANISGIDTLGDIVMEFDVFRVCTGPNIEYRLVSVGILPLRCSQIQKIPAHELIAEVNEQSALQAPVDWSTTLEAILSKGKVEYHRLLRGYGMDSRQTRADTALGLVNWCVLLWHTSWTLGLCSCRIRYAFLDRIGNGNATFTAMPCRLFNEDCHIVGTDMRARRALLLGVSLAQLALLTTIKVTTDVSGQTVFFIDRSRTSEDDLLKRVMLECCDDFKKAVQYCFFYDKRMIRDNRPLPAKDTILFQENVIDLLDKCYSRTVKRHMSWLADNSLEQ